MKARFRSFALLLAVVLCLGAAGVHAENWSEEYYRAYDATKAISESDRDELDAKCISLVSTYGIDLGMICTDSEGLSGEYTLEDYAREYYEYCGFGYGEDHDGFQFVYLVDTGEAVMLAFGRAEELVDDDWLEDAAEFAARQYEKHGTYGVLYGAWRYVWGLFEDTDEASGQSEQASAGEREDSGFSSLSEMPDWYPANTENFKFFHDEYAPRVVDDADIFSAADEKAMEARISVLRAELGRDIVVFTDSSTHGLSRAVYAADFYDFNGYGAGDDREGFCLFICMEPGNRGFWTCGTGPDTRSLQTEDVANALDDALYDYMAAGEYAEGVKDWIENIRTLYLKGIPFAPEWYPNRGETITRTQTPNSPRVVDEMGLLSASEVSALEKRVAELSGRYGFDIVIHTVKKPTGLLTEELADVFYSVMGYGTGRDYDGVQLTVTQMDYCVVSVYGAAAEKVSQTAENRLENRFDDARSSNCYTAMLQWLDQLEHVFKTGRAPRSFTSWLLTALAGAVGGSVFGGLALAMARGSMRTAKLKRDADSYIVNGGLRVTRVRDDFTGTTTSRRYCPPQRESSGGGGGGSSYSSSYSGSSGASHSGSGRSF